MAPAGCAVPEAPFGDIFLWSPEEAARNQFFDQALAEARIAALPTTDQTVALQNKAAAARLAWTPRLHNPQLPQWLHRINVRTQLIWGKQDKIVPAACARVFQAEIPGAALHVIDQCGHSLHTERAAECADFIAAFAGDVA